MIANVKNSLAIAALIAFDLVAFYLSLLAAYYSRALMDIFCSGFLPPLFSLSYFVTIWWFPATFIAFIAYEKLYVKKLPFGDETKELLKATSASAVAILSIITLGKMTDLSRLTVVFLWLFGLVFFPLVRFFGKRLLFASGLGKENVIIVGAGEAGLATAKGIQSDIHLGYNVIGFLDDDEEIDKHVSIGGRAYKVFGKVRHFRKFVKLLNVSTVIIAIPSLPVEKLSLLTNEIQKYTKSVLLVPDVRGVALTNTELYHLFMEQLFLLKINNNLKSPFNRALKRSFDLALSIMLLPALLPVIGVIGLLIKLSSKGPVFHIEDRFGKQQAIFKCIKFRTMFLNNEKLLKAYCADNPGAAEEWRKFKKLKGYDPRVTGIGKFLRRTSLDELPQIFNVLAGDMSLVGSRPYLPREENDMKYYIDTILLTPPGITGLWQVSGRNKLTFDDRLRLDSWYVLNWSLWLDIVILFKTIRVVVDKEGAY